MNFNFNSAFKRFTVWSLFLATSCMVMHKANAACPTPATIAAGNFTILNGENCTIDASDAAFGFFDVVEIGGTITIESGGSLTITTTGGGLSSLNLTGVLTVEDGGTLTVNGASGAMSVNDDGQLNLEPGSIANVSGDFYAGFFSDGGANIDGELNVGGDFNLTGSGTLSGDGEINADGDVNDNGGDSSGWQGDQTCNGGGTCDPLPVELISQTGNYIGGQDASITWKTATEINNEGFYLDKSINGIDFVNIGYVAGNGTTNEPQNYTFVDMNFSQSAYYRIKQVDYDGQNEIFPSFFVSFSDQIELSLYPNPVVNSLEIRGDHDADFSFQLFDMGGNSILQAGPSTLATISNEITQFLPQINPSVYILRLSSNETTQNIRFIKK